MTTRLLDTICTLADYLDEPTAQTSLRGTGVTDYLSYLTYWYGLTQGTDIPDQTVKSTIPPVPVYVDTGRWIWMCPDCRAASYAEDGWDIGICVECGTEWVDLVWPANRTEIEAELLRQPGRRLRAPIRHWKPDWSMDDLRARTTRALALRTAGVSPIRALSIGSVRAWATGEILTASNMTTYINEILEDLAGRNGVIEFEGNLHAPGSITSSTGGNRYIRVGINAGNPTQGTGATYNGRLAYNTLNEKLVAHVDNTWRQVLIAGLHQSDSGIKTFTSIPVLPSTDPTSANHAARKGYVDRYRIQNSIGSQLASTWYTTDPTTTTYALGTISGVSPVATDPTLICIITFRLQYSTASAQLQLDVEGANGTHVTTAWRYFPQQPGVANVLHTNQFRIDGLSSLTKPYDVIIRARNVGIPASNFQIRVDNATLFEI